MTKDEALDKKAENAKELGLDYEPVPHCEAGPDYCQQCLKEKTHETVQPT
jgi:hypothetical protein